MILTNSHDLCQAYISVYNQPYLTSLTLCDVIRKVCMMLSRLIYPRIIIPLLLVFDSSKQKRTPGSRDSSFSFTLIFLEE